MIPVNEPVLDGNEAKYVAECIAGGWISSEGPFVSRFEQEFSAKVGRRIGVAVANGSVALDAAIVALGIGPGDEVIMPSFTIISCAAAVVRAGATPVLVDCDPVTWNMDVGQVYDRVTPRTRAVMVVHIYGLPTDMAPLEQLAESRKLAIIEDAAEAHGQTYMGRPCGSFGSLSTFSFYPNKHVTTGEGGMIVTDSDVVAERCRSLRNLCFKPPRRFVHDELGWNFRMSNIQAALGVAQLERLERSLEKKRRIGQLYTSKLKDLGLPLQLPAERTACADNCYWVFGLVINDGVELDAEVAMRGLGERGVGTRPFFWPMHEQPVFKRMGLFEGERYPVSERIARRGFYVPSGLALSESQIDRVVGALQEVFG